MSIAIGITTTPDRHHIFWENLKKWQDLLPKNAYIYYVYNKQKIPVSVNKNKVLSMCAYADHIFMVDDDIYPITEDWWKPYTESPLNHACWNYDRNVIRTTVRAFKSGKGDVELVSYDELETPNGCMLYFKKAAIDKVGGWDTSFKGYGYEHVNLSDRIFNCGLTPARYIDIPNSKGLFELSDCESSFNSTDRVHIPTNYELYQQKFYSKEFKPFK